MCLKPYSTAGDFDALSEQLYRTDAICAEAFGVHDDCLCCPRQIAAILSLELNAVIDSLNEIEDFLAAGGSSPGLLLQICTRNGYGMACLHNNRIAMSCDGAPNLAFAVIDRHAYFYKTQTVAKHISKWSGGEIQQERLKRNTESTMTGSGRRNFGVGTQRATCIV